MNKPILIVLSLGLIGLWLGKIVPNYQTLNALSSTIISKKNTPESMPKFIQNKLSTGIPHVFIQSHPNWKTEQLSDTTYQISYEKLGPALKLGLERLNKMPLPIKNISVDTSKRLIHIEVKTII